MTCLAALTSRTISTRKTAATRKVWPILFCCINTGSLYIGLATSYNAEGFLKQFQMFCSLRGTPSFVYTDQGSNLVKAGKVQSEHDIPDMDWGKVQEITGT